MENQIRKLRRPLGLSQHRLGKRVGVTRISINHIENGKTIPSLDLANRIAQALGCSLYEVFDLDGTRRYNPVPDIPEFEEGTLPPVRF